MHTHTHKLNLLNNTNPTLQSHTHGHFKPTIKLYPSVANTNSLSINNTASCSAMKHASFNRYIRMYNRRPHNTDQCTSECSFVHQTPPPNYRQLPKKTHNRLMVNSFRTPDILWPSLACASPPTSILSLYHASEGSRVATVFSRSVTNGQSTRPLKPNKRLRPLSANCSMNGNLAAAHVKCVKIFNKASNSYNVLGCKGH